MLLGLHSPNFPEVFRWKVASLLLANFWRFHLQPGPFLLSEKKGGKKQKFSGYSCRIGSKFVKRTCGVFAPGPLIWLCHSMKSGNRCIIWPCLMLHMGKIVALHNGCPAKRNEGLPDEQPCFHRALPSLQALMVKSQCL